MSKLFSTRALSAFPCCGCLGISPRWICGADCRPVSKSRIGNILDGQIHIQNLQGHSDVFFFFSKFRADFGLAQNIQLLDGFFVRTELLALAGVDSLLLVGQKRDRGKTTYAYAVVASQLFWVTSNCMYILLNLFPV